MVLAINKKKSAVQAKESIPAIGSAKDLNKLRNYVSEVKRAPSSNEQVYVEELGPMLLTGIKRVQKEKKQDEEVNRKLEEVEKTRKTKLGELLLVQTQIKDLKLMILKVIMSHQEKEGK